MTETIDTRRGIVLYTDEEAKQNTIAAIKQQCENLNRFVKMTSNLLQRELSKEECYSLKERGTESVKEMLWDLFPHPEGDFDTNMKLIGKDIAPLQNYERMHFSAWKQLPMMLKDGKFSVRNIESLPQVARHTKRLTDPEMIEKYEAVKEFLEALNKARQDGILNRHNLRAITGTCNYIDIDYSGEYKILYGKFLFRHF